MSEFPGKHDPRSSTYRASDGAAYERFLGRWSRLLAGPFADFDTDFADYWEPLLGGQGPVGAYVESLPVEPRRLIEERVRLSYLSGAPDGPRSLTATAWAVRGVVP